jgi:hypothetical protein
VALAIAVLVSVGVVAMPRLQASPPVLAQVVVRVINDGAPGGPQVIGTAVVPLR